MVAEETRCENCRWWGGEWKNDEKSPMGTCRVRAPQTSQPKRRGRFDYARGEWPWTAANDWCGEFKDQDGRTEQAAAGG